MQHCRAQSYGTEPQSRFNRLLTEKGWEQEKVLVPSPLDRVMRIFYCYHPTYGYKRSPSLASQLA